MPLTRTVKGTILFTLNYAKINFLSEESKIKEQILRWTNPNEVKKEE